jgi:chromosome partitioning protein
MSRDFYTLKQISQLMGESELEQKIEGQIKSGLLPETQSFISGIAKKRGYAFKDLPRVLAQVAPFPRIDQSLCLCVFTTKGGVLKSTLSFNLARWYALQGHKTLVIGLDIQGDITNTLGHYEDIDDNEQLEDLIEKIGQTRGLYDFFKGQTPLQQLISPTEVEGLQLIPETPELVALNESISHINRREYWLSERVIKPLKEQYDVIILDCSPNWNKLTTNALVACDALISPIECKINNFRNFKVYKHLLDEFKAEMALDFANIFVPTKYSAQRKLSREIKAWYHENLTGCLPEGIRESSLGEEACALGLGLFEHAPTKVAGKEMINLLGKIQKLCAESLEMKSKMGYPTAPLTNHSHQNSTRVESFNSWR